MSCHRGKIYTGCSFEIASVPSKWNGGRMGLLKGSCYSLTFGELTFHPSSFTINQKNKIMKLKETLSNIAFSLSQVRSAALRFYLSAHLFEELLLLLLLPWWETSSVSTASLTAVNSSCVEATCISVHLAKVQHSNHLKSVCVQNCLCSSVCPAYGSNESD